MGMGWLRMGRSIGDRWRLDWTYELRDTGRIPYIHRILVG
jgi:hypothetical protein